MEMRLVKKSYSVHKSRAKLRGIDFNLTFDEWWGIWKPHYHNRGRGRGQFVMCRIMDTGAYEIGNVVIGTVAENAHTRELVNFERKIKLRKEAWAGFNEDAREDDEDGWLPRELKSPYRSSMLYL